MATLKTTQPAPKVALFDTAAKHFELMAQRANEGAAIMAAADAETEANGFLANLRVTEYLDLSVADLADWNPGTENKATDAVNNLHYYYSPESSPRARKAYAEAMLLAVCSVPEERARAARAGGDNADPEAAQYKAVPVRKLSTTGAKTGHFSGTSADAAAALDKALNEATAAGNDALADIYQRATDCATDMRKGEYSAIRRMASDLNKLQTRAKRWRSVLYLNVLKPALEAYDASDPATSVGRVWLPACDIAQSIHKDYWRDGGEAFVPDAGELGKKIDEAVNLYLGIKGDVEKARTDALAKEEANPGAAMVKALAAVLRAAHAVDSKMSCGLVHAVRSAIADQRTADALLAEYGIDAATVLGGKKAKGAAPAAPNANEAPTPAPTPAKPVRVQAAPAPVAPAPVAPAPAKPVRRAVATPVTTAGSVQATLNKIAARTK